jgi:hypothetical protein
MLNHSSLLWRRVLVLSGRSCLRIVPSATGCPALALGIMAVFSAGGLMGQPAQPGMQSSGSNLNRPNPAVVTNYNGWTNAILMSNGKVEAVVVPEAGRVMQFRFAGSTNGPFWENPALAGETSTPANWSTPGAMGGDKAWPAPSSDWPRHTPWSPPFGFDGSPYTSQITNGTVTLTGVVDADYQIRVTRTIELDPAQPMMRITTVFRRMAAPLRIKPLSVWVVTQVQDAEGYYVPVPARTLFPGTAYVQMGQGMPAQFKNTNGLISFTRDLGASHQLAFEANSLAWVGSHCAMRIDGARAASVSPTNYPYGGCKSLVFTGRGPDTPYAEMESFGSLTNLLPGQTAAFTTTYTLFHRTQADPDTEARAILGLAAR